MIKKKYVLDTSVYLTDYKAIYSFGKGDIIVPFVVFEELDNHKKRQDNVGHNARSIIRIFDNLRKKGSIHTGVRIKKSYGYLKAGSFNKDTLPAEYDEKIPDHQIIATALTAQQEYPTHKVVLVSCDINMRVKCDALGVSCEGYSSEKLIHESSKLYSGLISVVVPDEVINNFHKGEEIFIEKIIDKDIQLYPNEFLMLTSESNDKKTALAKFVNTGIPIKKVRGNEQLFGGITAKNKEQSCAIDLLMDTSIPLVSLQGPAGSGKTLCAIAAGLSHIIPENNTSKNSINKDKSVKENRPYTRLIISRPIQPLGKDLGYLPGTMEEKMLPWLSPIVDNLKFLLGNDKGTLESFLDKGLIEIEALTYIRGRSIENAFIIIDETQNLTQHEAKTILTRAGNSAKVVILGDLSQIDSPHVDEFSNGLTHAIEKMKGYDISGHITLTKGERSKLASIASQAL